MIDQIIKEIAEKKKLAILYGAGLSRDSGVLTAPEIYEYILSSVKDESGKVLIEKEIRNRIKEKSTPQMEDFLMRIYDDLNIEKNKDEIFRDLFGFYNIGEPNDNHYFLAELMKHDYVNWIYTTNFDLHFENAYGPDFNKDVVSLYNPEDSGKHDKNGINCFEKMVKDDPNQRVYVKLHGCVKQFEEDDMIGTLLVKVASKKQVELIKKPIEMLFTTEDGGKNFHDAVLVMGYSCSDVYDIVKHIREICSDKNVNRKKVYLLMHQAEDEKPYAEKHQYFFNRYLDENSKRKNPFVTYDGKASISFDGYVIYCNTSVFVKMLSERKKVKIEEKAESDRKCNIAETASSIIREWANRIQNADDLPFY